MSFNHAVWIIPVAFLITVYAILYIRTERFYFEWIKDHWFYKRSLSNKVSSYLWIIGFSLVCLALLDLRGPEEHVKGETVAQKTIILVDSSASMLAEDVRPNRFNKALLLVKHYIKKAVGQQISLVVFSDNQKRIVPFTEDMNLVKARINRLESMDLNRGGTGLSQALQESIQYFKNTSEDVIGNILIFSDAEETEFGFDIKIPDSISVALVGVGTRKGAPIPVRNSTGVFLGHKKFQGEEVVSKLDEDFMKRLSTIIKNYRYWIATSYSIPTEEILSFFNKTDEAKRGESEFRIRPILANYLLVPGIGLMILSVLLNFMRIFVPVSLLFIITSFSYANMPKGLLPNEKPKEPEKTPRTLELEQRLARNELPLEGQKALAFHFVKDGFPGLAEVLYEEVLEKELSNENLTDHFNYALALIQNKKVNQGVQVYAELLDYLEKYDGEEVKEFKASITKNVLKALEQQQSSGNGKSDQQNQDNQDKSEDQSQSDGKGDQNKDQQDQQDKNNQEQKEDQKDKGKDNKDQKNENEKNKDNEKDNKEKDSEKNQQVEKKEIPAILKQLLSDDNNLQKKLIDAGTTERKTRDKKDW